MSRPVNSYFDHDLVARESELGHHREVIGGMWEELGRLQRDWLVAQGLEPGMRLVDIGCGCLRAGVWLVDELEPGHYYGLDVSQALLDAGWERELDDHQRARLPRENLVCSDDFDLGALEVRFDAGIAQSVFTHLPVSYLRRCLEQLVPRFVSGGRFFVTFFECPEGHPREAPLTHEPGGIVTRPDADPFHHRFSDLEQAAEGLPWRAEHHGDWRHPRAQRMAIFHRL